jgi:hypothetical protein
MLQTESSSEQDDSSDIGDLGVNEGATMPHMTEYVSDSSSLSSLNAQNGEDVGDPGDNDGSDDASLFDTQSEIVIETSSFRH